MNANEYENEYGPRRRGMRGGMGGMGRMGGMRGAHGMHAQMHPYGMAFGRRGALRPIVLSLLSESPKNGAELSDAIESMYEWRPSPGALYPLLEELESEGLIRKKDERYELVAYKNDDFWPRGFGRPTSTFDIVARIDTWLSYFEEMQKRNPKGFEAYADKLGEINARLSELLGKAQKKQ
ncbi:MAG: PadR family transcriptional regulator [Candidatus Micrarchaeia archaeon]